MGNEISCSVWFLVYVLCYCTVLSISLLRGWDGGGRRGSTPSIGLSCYYEYVDGVRLFLSNHNPMSKMGTVVLTSLMERAAIWGGKGEEGGRGGDYLIGVSGDMALVEFISR